MSIWYVPRAIICLPSKSLYFIRDNRKMNSRFKKMTKQKRSLQSDYFYEIIVKRVKDGWSKKGYLSAIWWRTWRGRGVPGRNDSKYEGWSGRKGLGVFMTRTGGQRDWSSARDSSATPQGQSGSLGPHGPRSENFKVDHLHTPSSCRTHTHTFKNTALLKYRWKVKTVCIYLGYTIWCFDICIYCVKITTIKLMNIPITSR